MDLQKIRNETILYCLIFILALGLRMYNLGTAPLSDVEAGWAMQAFQIANPDPSNPLVLGPQPLFVFLTGSAFSLLEANNFLARFWTALFGSLLVLTPLFFRRELGQVPALLMAAGLAFDPGLAAVSRQAGSPVMAATLVITALGLWRWRYPLLAGICAGLALLSGPAVYFALLTVGAWLFISKRFQKNLPLDQDTSVPSADWRKAVLAGAATILLAGTFFSRHPQGLSALVNTITAFVVGFTQPPTVPFGQVLAASIFYQPLAWIFAALGVGRWLKGKISTAGSAPNQILLLVIGAILSLFITAIYPARSPGDLVWFHIFLWALASIELSTWLVRGEAPIISAVQAGVLVIASAMMWNILLSNLQAVESTGLPWNVVRTLVITGILGLAGLTSLLVAYGWSWSVSRTGLAGGIILSSIFYSTFVFWSASYIRPNNPVELWSSRQATADTTFFHQTLEDLSQWNSGFAENLDILVTIDRPSLRWLLRDFTKTRFASAVSAAEIPMVLITPLQEQAPVLEAAYRGQDFVWSTYQGWQGALPVDFIPWLTERRAPVSQEMIVLWARIDLFPGGTWMISETPAE